MTGADARVALVTGGAGGLGIAIAEALCADGTSVIENINQIDRGYEDIDGRLRSLGARIKRI